MAAIYLQFFLLFLLFLVSPSIGLFLKIPDWFPTLLHFSASFWLAGLLGMIWKRRYPKVFAETPFWWSWSGILGRAAIFGVGVEIFEYIFWVPVLMRIFANLYLYDDTIWDLTVNLVGSGIGAIVYLSLACRRHEILPDQK